MPPQYHASKSGNMNASQKRKEKNQVRETQNAVDDEEAIIGKATKSLGSKRFLVAINKDTEINVRIRGKGKNIPFIKPGDFVILSKDTFSNQTLYEIICPVNDKDMKRFRKRVSDSLMESELDDLFIREESKEGDDEEIDFENI